ncbi:MAG TPA: sialidase family protein [Candidatus Limnocylindrales bacterium]|nr:sialidase family protein [Candidatus Limnocylindrales bacterium]
MPRRLTILGAVAIGLFGAGGGVLADPQPVDFTHNVFNAPAPVPDAVFGTDNSLKPGQQLCHTAYSSAANVNTDCNDGSVGPHNETSIAVNPQDHDNIIGGANDYQLALNPGGHVSESVLSRAHVTFDGGHTWSMYPITFSSTYQATGDPAIAFDGDGHAYYATLGFRFVGPANAQNPDVLVANSGDGGITWSSVRVAAGSGNEGSVGDLLDKEYITAWGHGNALVTFGDFRLGRRGGYIASRIYSVVTHDSGKTWSAPTLISGTLHDAFVSVPAVTADGSAVYVSFMNTDDYATTGCANAGDCRDTYYVVKLNPSTGARIAGPTAVGLVYDGVGDYPIALGRQTYQDSDFRSWSAGNITVDPTNAQHLAVVWSDLRNGLATSSDPYSTTTDSDLIVSESTDGGVNWSTPTAITHPGDQFQSWAAFDGSGTLRIGTFDRGVTGANHEYGYSLVTGGSFSVVSTVNSDPTKDTRWFSGTTLNPDFPHPTSFIGDYSGIAVVPGTTQVVAYWTDLRNSVDFGGRSGSGEDAYFAWAS